MRISRKMGLAIQDNLGREAVDVLQQIIRNQLAIRLEQRSMPFSKEMVLALQDDLDLCA